MKKLLLVLALTVSGIINAQWTEQEAGNDYSSSSEGFVTLDGQKLSTYLNIYATRGGETINLWVLSGGFTPNSQVTISVIINGDKSTLKTGTLIADKDGDIKINSVVDLDYLFKNTPEVLYIKLGNLVIKVGIVGMLDTLVEAYNISNAAPVVNDPFGGDNPFGEDEVTLSPIFESYLDSYITVAKSVGVDLTFIYDGPIKIYFKDLSSLSDDPTKTILGVAYGSEDDDIVDIAIDPKGWEMLDDLGRTTLLFHELSHDILNASHVDNGAHLMHPTKSYTSILELVNGLTNILVEYRDGTIQKFNENTKY